MKFKKTRITAIEVSGSFADDQGAIRLRQIASEEFLPVIVRGESEFHSGRIYFPDEDAQRAKARAQVTRRRV